VLSFRPAKSPSVRGASWIISQTSAYAELGPVESRHSTTTTAVS
jgi:hypothetical protein